MNNSLGSIYNELKTMNPNATEGQLRQRAWVIRDRLIFEEAYNNNSYTSTNAASGSAGGGRIPQSIDPSTNNYVVDDYIDDYLE